MHRAAQAGPLLRFWDHETRGAFGAGAVGDPFESVNAVARVAADLAGGGFDDVGFAGGDDGGAFLMQGSGGACIWRFTLAVLVGEEICGGGAGEDRCGLN